jgi:hypothetical protein
MNIQEFTAAVDETEVSDADANKITVMLDVIEDRIVVADEFMASIYAARLIRLCDRMDIDPMDIVAFVEGESVGDAPEYPDHGFEVDDDGYLFWGIR